MEFTGNRLDLLAMAQKAAKVTNSSSPLKVMHGIYLEGDEDTGEVSMIATDFDASIYIKEKALVKESGKIVINARLLTDMLLLLDGDEVKCFTNDESQVTVSSGSCVYRVLYLPADLYPKPMMPLPDETVKLTNICSLVQKTIFATAKKNNDKPIFQCVSLRVMKNGAHAAASDGLQLMLVKNESQNYGEEEFLLPAQPFRTLASISTDEDIFHVGKVGTDTVFMKQNMLFSIKNPTGKYMDTSSVIKSVKPEYSAIVDTANFKAALDIMRVGDGTAPVNIIFSNDAIKLRRTEYAGISSTEVKARVDKAMPGTGFYYKLEYLIRLFQVLHGTVRIDVDSKGMMLIRSKAEIYFQIPVAAPKKPVKPKQETMEESVEPKQKAKDKPKAASKKKAA